MAHYTDADAARVFSRDISEVHRYYAELAAQRRPAALRAAARLQGQPEPEPESAVEQTDEDAEDEGGPGEDATEPES